MSDVRFKKCDSCGRPDLDGAPNKCGPVTRYAVMLEHGRYPGDASMFQVDVCQACAAQRPIKALLEIVELATGQSPGDAGAGGDESNG